MRTTLVIARARRRTAAEVTTALTASRTHHIDLVGYWSCFVVGVWREESVMMN
jgi:hypothetical protein